mmetsp:Transcript_22381/g.41939  ORF Transcript_22381/g.41939 Transcript_22381/m.41939 type:complete len:1085 (-) Transcript_22381:135-3389(-)
MRELLLGQQISSNVLAGAVAVFTALGWAFRAAILRVLVSLGLFILFSGASASFLWTVFPDFTQKLFAAVLRVTKLLYNYAMSREEFIQAFSKASAAVHGQNSPNGSPGSVWARGGKRKRGILHAIGMREITGRPIYRQARDLPDTLLKLVDEREHRIPSLVRQLNNSLQPLMAWYCTQGLTCRGCHENQAKLEEDPDSPCNFSRSSKRKAWLEVCTSLLEEAHRVVCELSPEAVIEDLHPDQPLAFVQYGGAALLAQFILCTTPGSLHGRGVSRSSYSISRAWATALDILREVCLCIPRFGMELAQNKEFLRCVFGLMKVTSIFENALHLFEELLCDQPDPVKLANIESFEEFALNLNGKDLAAFCRIFALLIHEREELGEMEQPLSLGLILARTRALRSDSNSCQNQAFLVKAPNVMKRLVHILRNVAMVAVDKPKSATPLQRRVVPQTTQEMLAFVGQSRPGQRELLEVLAADQIHPGNLREALESNGDDIVQVRRRQVAQFTMLLIEGGHTEPHPLNVIPGQMYWNSVPNPIGEDKREEEIRNFFDTGASQEILDESNVFVDLHDEPALEGTCTEFFNEVMSFAREHCASLPEFPDINLPLIGSHVLSSNSQETVDPHLREDGVQRLRLQNITSQVEVLFVLAVLSGGRSKEKANNALASYGIVPVLDHLFDRMDWVSNHNHAAHNGIHGANCECNPLSALKIQFLRLVHNFCDREDSVRNNKRLLLNSIDLRVCKLLRCSEPESLQYAKEVYRSLPEKYQPSLLHKLVKLLMSKTPDSQYHYWLASTIEAFLRGGSNEEQLLLTSWGLMDHLLTQLLDDVSSHSQPGMLQTNFDLLGELTKFNRQAFHMLSSIPPERFKRLMRLALSHLVDSNVFFRWTMATLENIRGYDPDFLEENQFEIALKENRIHILRRLMNIVSLEKISQENICCINTALLILLFAHRNGELANLLDLVDSITSSETHDATSFDDEAKVESVKKQELELGDQSTLVAKGSSTLEENKTTPAVSKIRLNFRRLLWFWRHYYLQSNDQDRLSLSLSNRIPFDEFTHVTDVLCADDGSPTSLIGPGQLLNLPTLLDLV